MSTVTITMTLDQAAAMARLLDLATRIHLCQFGEIEYLARTGDIWHKDGHSVPADSWEALGDACSRLSQIFGFSSNASFGIGSPHVSKDAHRGYEVKKVIEKALAEHRDPNPSFRGVNYDGVIVRYTDDPVPVATITE